MPSDFDTIQAAAGVYAEALLSLAADARAEDALSQDLAGLAELWQRAPDFALALSTPAIGREARREMLRRILSGRVSPHTLNLLLLLNDKQRLVLLPDVCEAFARALERRRGERRVYVTTISPLEDAERAALLASLGRLLAGKPVLFERTDAEILGGLRVQVGDHLIDRTLNSRLRRLAADLRRRIEAHLLRGARPFVVQETG